MRVVGEAANGEDAVRARPRARAGRRRHGHRRCRASAASRRRGRSSRSAPLTRVLVLTISDQDADVVDAIVAGACGYLLKDAVDRRPGRGHPRGGDRRRADLARDRGGLLPRTCDQHVATGSAGGIPTQLSARELDVLKLVANGQDNAEIARELFISPKTVKNHISNILMKLQIENRIQAAVYAVRSGLV